MGLLQVLKAWELAVEVLSQMEHFLAYVKDLVLSHLAHSDEPFDDLRVDQVLSPELFADLERNVDGADSQKRRVSEGEAVVVHRHLGEVDAHLLNEEVLQLGFLFSRGPQIFGHRSLLFFVLALLTSGLLVVGQKSQVLLLLGLSP